MHCKTFTSILVLNPLDAKASPSGDNQNCLQALPNVPWLRTAALIREYFFYANLLVNLFLHFTLNDQMIKEAFFNVNYLLTEGKQREDFRGPMMGEEPCKICKICEVHAWDYVRGIPVLAQLMD